MGREIGDNLYASCAGEGYYPDSGNTADQNTPEKQPDEPGLALTSISLQPNTKRFLNISEVDAPSAVALLLRENDSLSITITKPGWLEGYSVFLITKG